MVAVTVGLTLTATGLAQSRRTIWDGVYNETQAQRGAKAYANACSSCHDAGLGGGDEGQPALAGPSFLVYWQDRTLGDLVASISRNMPRNAPGSLSPRDYIDITSYMLKVNGTPAGSADLVEDSRQLQQIAITPEPQAR